MIQALMPDPKHERLKRVATEKNGPKWKLVCRKRKRGLSKRFALPEPPEMIEHRYPIRPDMFITIMLPEDFNSKEARRLAQAVQCFPMGDHYDPDLFVRTV